jgi:hypothetical protein
MPALAEHRATGSSVSVFRKSHVQVSPGHLYAEKLHDLGRLAQIVLHLVQLIREVIMLGLVERTGLVLHIQAAVLHQSTAQRANSLDLLGRESSAHASTITFSARNSQ